MGVLRVQENIKNEDGTYDVVHKETEAGLVLFDDNETFQQKYDAGELTGEPGTDGAPGKDGKSAYQAAVEAGYTGTEAEFYAALVSLQDGPFLPLSGGTMAENAHINFNNGGLGDHPLYEGLSVLNNAGTGTAPLTVSTPVRGAHAATKKYVDDSIGSVIDFPSNNKLVFVSATYYTDDIGPSDFYKGSRLIPAVIDTTESQARLRMLSPIYFTREDSVRYNYLVIRILDNYNFRCVRTDAIYEMPMSYMYHGGTGGGIFNRLIAKYQVVSEADNTKPYAIPGDIKICFGEAYENCDGKLTTFTPISADTILIPAFEFDVDKCERSETGS